MAFDTPKLGDWTCYSNDTNKLQTHNASHKKPKTEKSPTLSSKLKHVLTSPFRKSNPRATDATNDDDDNDHHDEWTCHDRKLMRYTAPPLGSQTIITGGSNVVDNNAAMMAKKREQYYSRSTTLDGEDDYGDTVSLSFPDESRVHDHAKTVDGASLVFPTIPQRSTLRVVKPTSPGTLMGDQAVPRSLV